MSSDGEAGFYKAVGSIHYTPLTEKWTVKGKKCKTYN